MIGSIAINGQLVAAVAVLIDGIFGLLYVLGIVHNQPDQGLVAGVVAVVFNAMAALLAYIQHSQQTAVVKAALAAGHNLQLVNGHYTILPSKAA
jgi:hypothetical protein